MTRRAGHRRSWSRRTASLLLALVAVTPACFVVGGRGTQGPRLAPELLASLTPGVSTRLDVLTALGPPSEYLEPDMAALLLEDELRLSSALDLSRRSAGVWTWQWDEVAAGGTLLVLYNQMDVTTRSELVVAFFDADGVLLELVDSRERSS